MAFTYEISSGATRDQLRLLIQDTVDTGHLLEDAEIEAIVALEANVFRAAGMLCRVIAAKILRGAAFKDDIEWDPEQKAEEYRKLGIDFDKKAGQSAGLNVSGAAMLANLTGVNCETLARPAFTRNLHIGENADLEDQ
jgi:hypothetical protein